MSRILLGANYYPEDWDENLVDLDIKKMRECGFNVVRIAEFAWKRWSRRREFTPLNGFTVSLIKCARRELVLLWEHPPQRHRAGLQKSILKC